MHPTSSHPQSASPFRAGPHACDKRRTAVADLSTTVCVSFLPPCPRVSCALVYPNAATTELRCRLALRCSRPGAHDVLDIAAITTYDRELGGELPAGPQLGG